MTLYSILLSVFSPHESVWRRRKLAGFEKVRVFMYRALLKCGQKAYRNLAVFDVVSAAGGRIKVTHEYRDLEFEAKLKKAKLTLPLSYKVTSFPFEDRMRRRGFGWRWFNFADTLVVEIDRKKIYVEHGNLYKAFGSEDDVTVKRTESQGGLDAAFFTMAASLTKPTAKKGTVKHTPSAAKLNGALPHSGKPTVKPGLLGVDGRGMFGRNPLPESRTGVSEIPVQKSDKEPPIIIRKGGVEIDTSF
jgi:hypothetical protein